MDISDLVVEQSFDPGFTLVVAVDNKKKWGEWYIRERNKTISNITPISNIDWHEIRSFGWGDFEPLQKFIDKIAIGIQFQRGWRIEY